MFKSKKLSMSKEMSGNELSNGKEKMSQVSRSKGSLTAAVGSTNRYEAVGGESSDESDGAPAASNLKVQLLKVMSDTKSESMVAGDGANEVTVSKGRVLRSSKKKYGKDYVLSLSARGAEESIVNDLFGASRAEDDKKRVLERKLSANKL